MYESLAAGPHHPIRGMLKKKDIRPDVGRLYIARKRICFVGRVADNFVGRTHESSADAIMITVQNVTELVRNHMLECD